jgi:hypothetical protein
MTSNSLAENAKPQKHVTELVKQIDNPNDAVYANDRQVITVLTVESEKLAFTDAIQSSVALFIISRFS